MPVHPSRMRVAGSRDSRAAPAARHDRTLSRSRPASCVPAPVACVPLPTGLSRALASWQATGAASHDRIPAGEAGKKEFGGIVETLPGACKRLTGWLR